MVPVKPQVAKGARVSSFAAYESAYKDAGRDPETYWREAAARLNWFQKPEAVFRGDMTKAEFEWYAGGQLNASYNCVDRHAATTPDKTALIWVQDEPGEYAKVSYRELLLEVGRM